MKVIKAKSNKASEKASWLTKGAATSPAADRVLVVYGEESASIYYEAAQPAAKPATRAL